MSLPVSDVVRKLPIRVAVVTHALSPHRLALMECVAASVDELRVFLSQADDKLHKFPFEGGSLAVTIQKSLNWEHQFQNVHGYRDISHVHVPYDTYQQLTRYKPDVVISTELGMRSLLSALYCSRRRAAKLVLWATLSERTEETRGRLRTLVRGWLVSKVDSVFVNGDGGASYIRQLGYRGPMFIVPYAIDDTPFRTVRYEPTPGTFRLLYTGLLIPRKGLQAFCRVLSQWSHDHPAINVEFTLVGEGSDSRSLRELSTAANLSIQVFDRVNQEQLVRYHENSDLFAFPTLGDEWGVVVNEALIAGRPVLGSVHSQAVMELVQEGENGWLWNPEVEGSLYAALSRVFSCGVEDLKALSRNAKESVLRISPPLVANIMLDGLEHLSES